VKCFSRGYFTLIYVNRLAVVSDFCLTLSIGFLATGLCAFAAAKDKNNTVKTNVNAHYQSKSSKIRFRSSFETNGISIAPLPLSFTLNFTFVANFDARSFCSF
jgi:hypothetical protein